MREYELEAKLAESLGKEAARAALDALIAEWGGCRLDIPNGATSRKTRRDNEIRRKHQAGVDMFALRDQFGLSDRHLRRILSAIHGTKTVPGPPRKCGRRGGRRGGDPTGRGGGRTGRTGPGPAPGRRHSR